MSFRQTVKDKSIVQLNVSMMLARLVGRYIRKSVYTVVRSLQRFTKNINTALPPVHHAMPRTYDEGNTSVSTAESHDIPITQTATVSVRGSAQLKIKSFSIFQLSSNENKNNRKRISTLIKRPVLFVGKSFRQKLCIKSIALLNAKTHYIRQLAMIEILQILFLLPLYVLSAVPLLPPH